MSKDKKASKNPAGGMTYRDAGVDIGAKYKAVQDSGKAIRSTWGPGVLGDLGSFGGLFRLDPGRYRDPILVSSADGVGTKIQVAVKARKHNTVGRDLVNHCVNDILVQGATPLFFLDYIGTGLMEEGLVPEIIEGIAAGCRENQCALIGGETAEMPGVYQAGDYDLVGFIVGVVERDQLIDGSRIQVGDEVIAFPSAGLHTNGYSLARKVFFEKCGLGVHDPVPGMGTSVGEALLAPHLSYLEAVRPYLEAGKVHGMAHITGGGLQDNVPRVLPEGISLQVDRNSWDIPPLFQAIQKEGSVDSEEMFHIFNMGVGYLMAIPPEQAGEVTADLKARNIASWNIGKMVTGEKTVTWK